MTKINLTSETGFLEADFDQIYGALVASSVELYSITADALITSAGVNVDTLASSVVTNNAKISYPSADSTKVGYLTVTQAIDLDTFYANYLTTSSELDTVEADVLTNSSNIVTLQADVLANSAAIVPFDIDSATPLDGVTRIRTSDWNFIENSSFESWLSGTTSAPDGWTLQGTATIARDSSPYQGTYSAELTFGAATDGELYAIYTASSNVDYTYTAYVTRISGTGEARLVAQQNFGSYTEDKSVALSTVAGQQLAALTFKPSADGNYRIAFKATDANGSVWRIDEVKVQESKDVATTWTPCFVNDSFNQNIYGNKTFLNTVTVGGYDVGNDFTPKLTTITSISGAHTIASSDSSCYLRNSGANTYTLPLDLSTGFSVTVMNTDGSTITYSSSGTINGKGTTQSTQWGAVTATYIGSSVWDLVGDLD